MYKIKAETAFFLSRFFCKYYKAQLLVEYTCLLIPYKSFILHVTYNSIPCFFLGFFFDEREHTHLFTCKKVLKVIEQLYILYEGRYRRFCRLFSSSCVYVCWIIFIKSKNASSTFVSFYLPLKTNRSVSVEWTRRTLKNEENRY